jgi:hypothetical protein
MDAIRITDTRSGQTIGRPTEQHLQVVLRDRIVSLLGIAERQASVIRRVKAHKRLAA